MLKNGWVFLVFLCISINLRADELEKKNTAQIISLGGDCHTTIALRDLGFRKEAFPFDWVISTDHSVFIKILNEDFYNFLDENCFVIVDGVPSRRNIYYVFDFPHDFDLSEDRKSEWASFKEKYERRIERFRALRLYQGKVFFIRTLWSQPTEEVQENYKRTIEIRDALDRYFPELDYTLIIWSYSDLNIPALEPIEHVIELRIPRAHRAFHDKMIDLLGPRTLF